MELRIRGNGISVTEGMRAAVERRVRFAFDRFATAIVRVDVRFADVNGPRGGEDKSCAVAVTLRDLPTVRATERSADAYASLDVAVHRASRGIARAIERKDEEGPRVA